MYLMTDIIGLIILLLVLVTLVVAMHHLLLVVRSFDKFNSNQIKEEQQRVSRRQLLVTADCTIVVVSFCWYSVKINVIPGCLIQFLGEVMNQCK